MTSERSIPTTIHGRVLTDIPASPASRPLLVGYHGYGEQADIQLERLRGLRGDASFGLVSLQGLHRFYGRNIQASDARDVVASWMTRQHREVMIADNVTYVNTVLGALADEFGEPPATIHVGFSQGASMAYRAAALARQPAAAVIAVGGDIPPDLDDERLSSIPAVLIGWGVRDRFYDAAKRAADEQRLRLAGVRVLVLELDAGHAWTDTFTAEAAAWVSAFA